MHAHLFVPDVYSRWPCVQSSPTTNHLEAIDSRLLKWLLQTLSIVNYSDIWVFENTGTPANFCHPFNGLLQIMTGDDEPLEIVCCFGRTEASYPEPWLCGTAQSQSRKLVPGKPNLLNMPGHHKHVPDLGCRYSVVTMSVNGQAWSFQAELRYSCEEVEIDSSGYEMPVVILAPSKTFNDHLQTQVWDTPH